MAHFMHLVMHGLSQRPDAPFMRSFTGTADTFSWDLITCKQYQSDMEKVAGHYQKQLSSIGAKPGCVVGLWMTGERATDYVHIYGLCRAGFVPELFSIYHFRSGPTMVGELLELSDGKALLYDSTFATAIGDITLPSFPLADISSLQPPTGLSPIPDVAEEDFAIIFHTSGTTGGRPKPVPQTHKWCKAHASVCWPGIWQGSFDSPDVVNTVGNFAHAGAASYVYKSAFTGGSFVQTSRPDIGAEEFLALVRYCGLNRLLQFSAWLSVLLKIARQNEDVLEALRGLRQVVYTGSSLNPEDEAWALGNGIPITCLYASTEASQCLVSDLGAKDLSMRRIVGLEIEFIPSTINDHHVELFDLLIPETDPNCPHASVRNRVNGHVTGNLFEQVKPGYYLFCGRDDDWIKSRRAAFCNTKAIEDNVLQSCADIVRNCVVVGHLKPCIVLLIEAPSEAELNATSSSILKDDVLKRIRGFNDRLMPHERIIGPEAILVTPPGSLPRTSEKGNIRRKAAHDQFANELAVVWGDV